MKDGFPNLTRLYSSLTPQKLFNLLAPNNAPLVKVHLRHSARSQAVDRIGQFLTESFSFDGRDGSEVCFEREEDRAGLGKAVEGLAFAAEMGLE